MKDKAEKKVSFRETIRVAWKPYKRLYTYVGPYKWRFILGLALGFLFGVTQGCLPLVLQKVTSTDFPRRRTQCPVISLIIQNYSTPADR